MRFQLFNLFCFLVYVEITSWHGKEILLYFQSKGNWILLFLTVLEEYMF